MSPFAELIGQPQAVELLTQAIARDRVAPAYLFAGATGVGRSLAAECFIELVFHQQRGDRATEQRPEVLRQRVRQRNHPDLLWVEPTYLHQGKRLSAKEAEEAGVKRRAPPQIRLDQIREVTQFLSRPPLECRRSLVVLEQAETMAEPAANALLKTLEEPGRATLILIAPSVESLLPTLVSRCQRIPFYRLSGEAIAQVLHQHGHSDIIQQPEVLALAQGSPGEAIGHWQQLQAIPPDLLQAVKQRPTTLRAALELARQIDKTLSPENQLWLVGYLQQWYWQQTPRPHPVLLQQFEKIRQQLLQYVQPRLVWEVALMAMVN